MAGSKRKLDGDDSLEQYVSCSNDVIRFSFVLKSSELDFTQETFLPDYTHQFFGSSENIFGYVGLKVDIIYSACLLNPYFNMSFRHKVQPDKTGGIEADDVLKIIVEKQELDLETDLTKFKASLEKESTFQPYGSLLDSFELHNKKYKLYKADHTVEGFRSYHERMRTLILWFIDAASYFDDEDEKWDYFLLHEEVKIDGKTYYPFIGYTTVYRYYAYPQNTRPRISQMLILPPYQKKGFGTQMLENISKYYIADPEVIDITVEEPSDEFTTLRDFVDCRNCLKLPSFENQHLIEGFNQSMIDEAREQLKLNKKQARRVYEILRFRITNLDNEKEYKAFRIDVKNRLNIPFQREQLNLDKMHKMLSDDEMKIIANPIPRDQRLDQLNQMYQDLELKYKHINERLMSSCSELSNGTAK